MSFTKEISREQVLQSKTCNLNPNHQLWKRDRSQESVNRANIILEFDFFRMPELDVVLQFDCRIDFSYQTNSSLMSAAKKSSMLPSEPTSGKTSMKKRPQKHLALTELRQAFAGSRFSREIYQQVYCTTKLYQNTGTFACPIYRCQKYVRERRCMTTCQSEWPCEYAPP